MPTAIQPDPKPGDQPTETADPEAPPTPFVPSGDGVLYQTATDPANGVPCGPGESGQWTYRT